MTMQEIRQGISRAKDIISKIKDIDYIGIQYKERGLPGLVMFSDRQTRRTLAISITGLTTDKIRDKISQARLKFRQ